MLPQKKSFIAGRIASLKYAFVGFKKLATTEHSIISQLIGLFIVSCAGFYFKISATEWMIQTLAFFLVLSIEGLNTAVEKIADFIHPEFHKKIGEIKDIAAGAVTFAALGTLIILTIIYLPKFNIF
ncbi:diacylglycerol kinase family protein [Paenimyroides tangerinum]|uniref:Diacylglycerol kinase family protein n=1 Tax=Paenimyroides tangerinum TaxID=2488728 RepID=A0A3P3VZH3_9FLAO|nr:diacylglycerol kinase family protein [Paenimyroides tangerinum]RRJ88120.1 diacylglycerol kinase family protein [Paenimyroides tangerinum]